MTSVSARGVPCSVIFCAAAGVAVSCIDTRPAAASSMVSPDLVIRLMPRLLVRACVECPTRGPL